MDNPWAQSAPMLLEILYLHGQVASRLWQTAVADMIIWILIPEAFIIIIFCPPLDFLCKLTRPICCLHNSQSLIHI